jgi:nicotinate-nucleotide adenylyltransferase
MASLFFITGADAFRDIGTWMNYPGVLERCHFVVVSRRGLRATDLGRHLPGLADRMVVPPCATPDRPGIFLVDAETSPVSSTGVRERLSAGLQVDGLVPSAVAGYIARHGLYGWPTGAQ